jgi:hypothetical protein
VKDYWCRKDDLTVEAVNDVNWEAIGNQKSFYLKTHLWDVWGREVHEEMEATTG